MGLTEHVFLPPDSHDAVTLGRLGGHFIDARVGKLTRSFAASHKVRDSPENDRARKCSVDHGQKSNTTSSQARMPWGDIGSMPAREVGHRTMARSALVRWVPHTAGGGSGRGREDALEPCVVESVVETTER